MAKVLSVEIGATLIHMCEVDYMAKHPKVYNWVTIPTPENAVKEDEILDEELLASAIRDAMQANKIRTKKMIFTMSSTKIASREVMIPYIKENRVADLIRSNSSDYFPVDLTQYELGQSIVGVLENDKGLKQYKVLVYAAPKTILEGYTNLAKAIGGTVVAMDYCGNSLFQVVREHCNTGVQMITSLEGRHSLITILKDGVIALQRTISYGIDDAVTVIMNSENHLNYTYMQALQLLTETDCLMPEQEEGISASLNGLVSGLLRVADYYNSRNSEEPIENVYITGGGSNLMGMREFLAKALDMHVLNLREVETFSLGKYFKDCPYGQYVLGVGAAMTPLGFLGEKAEKGKKMDLMPAEGDMKNLAILGCAGGVLIAIVLALVSWMNLNSAREENKDLQARITELRPIEDVYHAYLQQTYTYTKLNFLYNSTVLPGDSLIAFLEELEQKMPSSLNIQSFQANTESISLSLTVKDKREASKLIQQLRTFESISGIAVSGISDTGAVMEGEPMETEGMVSFSVTLTFQGANAIVEQEGEQNE